MIVKTYKGHDVPEGATHYHQSYFYKVGDMGIVFKGCSGWQLSSYTNLESLKQQGGVALPQEPEHFYPQAGTYCEVLDGVWHQAWYIGRDEDGVPTYRYDGTLHNDSRVKFRPIKTERENIKEWVESKIDCVESFQLDMTIMITKMLDLGCLIIPEDGK